ncbi:predicted protein [Aspergillus terreus NIH2624]|uniref:Uncharacterized protein n=1 Tax=Aspergillus terreus (strain NIH 2624 / FGSC A1156) TaxID=341663 RepID=Q0CJQ2_ASPTN|nr:uncharacterized protein ATEG_06082 [Aspergillus terreus NIH2624]EAU33843.1 predicted protein [Aspergillus terreus NIH2624]
MPATNENSSLKLLQQDLYQRHYDDSARTESLERSYLRARQLARHHALTLDDVLSLTPKFWDAHMDGIIVRDVTAQILWSIQFNLVAGTVAPFALQRPDLHPFMEKLLNFDITTPFMLNELDHGCDAKNLETTATWQPDGSFMVHSPSPGAAKFMPPSMPVAGIPRVAVVFCRLMVEGDDRGIRPFLVPLNDGRQMCTGVMSQMLPPIASGRVLDHALTSFNQVQVPSTALLGELEKPDNMRDRFLSAIQRVGFGTLALSLWTIPFMKCATYLGGKYSLRRMVVGSDGKPMPIISFRTQQVPILHSLAQVTIMMPFANWITSHFSDTSLDFRVRHGLGVILKATFLQFGQGSIAGILERCGAQGVFIHNQLVELEALTRGNGIAEGDCLVLCIRLATELLIGRYAVPKPARPDSLLAQHEAGYVRELQAALKSIKKAHRSDEYNSLIIPRCRPLIIAIGHRMAYEAALDAGIDADLLALAEAGMVNQDLSWYSENLGFKRFTQYQMERRAMDRILPRLDQLLDELEIGPYCVAPFQTAERFAAFVRAAPAYTGEGVVDLSEEKETFAPVQARL